jgi:hypothetical protein
MFPERGRGSLKNIGTFYPAKKTVVGSEKSDSAKNGP